MMSYRVVQDQLILVEKIKITIFLVILITASEFVKLILILLITASELVKLILILLITPNELDLDIFHQKDQDHFLLNNLTIIETLPSVFFANSACNKAKKCKLCIGLLIVPKKFILGYKFRSGMG